MARHESDALFGLATLGDVFVGGHPAAVGRGLVHDRHDAAVTELLEVGVPDTIRLLREQIGHRAAVMVASMHAQLEHIAEGDPWLQEPGWQVEKLAESSVHDLEPI